MLTAVAGAVGATSSDVSIATDAACVDSAILTGNTKFTVRAGLKN